jgi:hypothetical protein
MNPPPSTCWNQVKSLLKKRDRVDRDACHAVDCDLGTDSKVRKGVTFVKRILGRECGVFYLVVATHTVAANLSRLGMA